MLFFDDDDLWGYICMAGGLTGCITGGGRAEHVLNKDYQAVLTTDRGLSVEAY